MFGVKNAVQVTTYKIAVFALEHYRQDYPIPCMGHATV